MVYLRRGSRIYWITVATRTKGEYRHISTGTRNEQTAVAMAAMWLVLGGKGKRQWDLVDAVLSKRLDLARLYDHYMAETLDVLRAELVDVDLSSGLAEWDRQLEDQYRGETPRKYRHQITALFPRSGKGKGEYENAPRSRVLTPGYIAGQLARVSGSRTNRRRHHEAWTSAFDYLLDHGLVERNPMRDVRKPKPDKSKTPHVDRYEDVLRLISAFPAGPHRAAAALREGAGMEMQAVRAMRARDVVDVAERIVWAHGGKNEWRDRQVMVDAECFEIFLAYFRSVAWLPDVPLFSFSAYRHGELLRDACEEARKQGAEIPAGYTPHAARHSYAIRKMRANAELTLIANNLGHADTTEVQRLYGKYRPKITDIRRAGQAQEGR